VSKDRSTILTFALVGLGITVVFIAFQMLMVEHSPWFTLNNILSAMFMIFCPPAVLTFPLLDVEIGSGGFYFLWMVVALLNAAVYAVIGTAYVRRRQKRAESTGT